MWNRRQFLRAGVASGLVGVMPPAAFGAGEIASLGALAAESDLMFGTAFLHRSLEDVGYLDLIAKHARILTPENSLKYDYMNPTGAGHDFSRVDAMMAFARKINAKTFAQPLFWNDYYPPWLDGLSVKELQYAFDEHIEKVVSHYAGQMHSWGVVNEPFAPWDNLPNAFRDGPWYWAFGESYVARAFERTAAIDAGAKLILNEAQCENDYKWGKAIRPQLLGLIDRLLDAGVPLHGVGLQGHLQPQWDFDYEAHARYIEEIAARGLDIYITELDVNDMAFAGAHDKRDAQIGAHYADYLGHVLALPAIKTLIVWDLSDRYSWYRELAQGWRKDARSLLFDERLMPKTAYFALEIALQKRKSSLNCG